MRGDGSQGSDGTLRTQEHATGFMVDLPAYAGPFDALLSMIANNKLELTQISLFAITEEFLDYVRSLDLSRNMDEASAFIDVASILVEAKSVALLPGGLDEERDEQSLEALRERDMLFARLVQYRAFKGAASDFRERMQGNAGRYAHPAALDSASRDALPELEWTMSPQELASLAAQVMRNAPAPQVSVRQLHVSKVDLKAQLRIVGSRLRALPQGESLTFDELVQGASRLEVVARFLSLLLFFKQGLLRYRQDGPFEDLHLRWSRDGAANGSATDGTNGVEMDISEDDFS